MSFLVELILPKQAKIAVSLMFLFAVAVFEDV